ncbi:2-methylaconitate cis-trans isomerase PrpF family protein [Lutispora sp.]|uniref:2-methylaconitate cis-trans isomerase PrpF family protein n=1 Tax=Lutispora sp. TaxID=2828727 RepID=UPI002B20FF54|nr:PrpF domain-containing protein [Lutispora sp.]MEA4960740.1 PrpF domain-containing protein [Lutispora sp.]
MFKEVQCIQFRGGTSKGLFFLESDLPEDKSLWPHMLLSLMGSPDNQQVDGLGGAIATASKAAIVSKSDMDSHDVDYLFAQVSVDKPIVSFKGNCGNICSAVGPYAIESGLVKATDPLTLVRIHNVNTDKIIHAYVPTKDNKVLYEGDFEIAGVPGYSACIKMAFKNPSGSVTGRLLPTGNAVDIIDIPDYGSIEVSYVDSSNPFAFIRAADIGMRGDELPNEIDRNPKLMPLLEKIRGVAAVNLGFIADYKDSSEKSPTVPKLAMASAPKSYVTANGKKIDTESYDILCRMMSMQKAHKNYALTGAMCTASAAIIEGTIVNQLVRKSFDAEKLLIGHPGGIMPAGVEYEIGQDGNVNINWSIGYRTARMLMRGAAFYRTV